MFSCWFRWLYLFYFITIIYDFIYYYFATEFLPFFPDCNFKIAMLDRVENELQAFQAVVDKTPNLQTFLVNPSISRGLKMKQVRKKRVTMAWIADLQPGIVEETWLLQQSAIVYCRNNFNWEITLSWQLNKNWRQKQMILLSLRVSYFACPFTFSINQPTAYNPTTKKCRHV